MRSLPRATPCRNFRLLPVLLMLSSVSVFLACSRGSAGDPSKVRRMVSYSLLENLEQAEIRHPQNIVIEPRLVKAGDVQRPAIFAHAPSEIRFKSVRFYPGSRLGFGVGLNNWRLGTKADGVRFIVRLESVTRAPIELWSRTLNPEGMMEDRSWIDVDLDLGAHAGQVADLVLITDELENRAFDFSAWSLPVLRSDGAVSDLDELPVLREIRSTALDASASVQTIKIPARGLLELVGEGTRVPGGGTGATASATFSVRVDGEQIFTRSLRISGVAANFFQTLPLDDFAGETVELSLEIKKKSKADPRSFTAKWLRARLVEMSPTPRQHRSTGPNLLFVVVDTLRADHLSLYGYGRKTSPNLDGLASQSLIFDRAISQSSWTMPAVASLLTGLYPPEHGVKDGQHLESQFRTISEILQESGFTTFGVSANPVVGRQEGFHQGFERFVHLPFATAGDVNSIFQPFVEENRDLRWFGYLHYIDPHDPYRAPGLAGRVFTEGRENRFSSDRDFMKLWDAVNFGRGQMNFEESDLEYLRAAYDEEIRYWDSEFGALLDRLKTMGLLEDTVVIVTSDHGEEFLEHGKLKHGMQLYEESIWVPLIIWAPDMVKPGHREREVETLGIIHGALELMAVEGLDERSSEPWFSPAPQRQRPTFSHTTHALLPDQKGRRVMASVRDAEWKFITYLDTDIFELYNLRDDPAEQFDEASKNPQVAARYRALLDRWLVSSKPLVTGEADLSEGNLEKLRALGYIQ